jgi:hypothetical protein
MEHTETAVFNFKLQNCSETFLKDSFLRVLHMAGSGITLSLAYNIYLSLWNLPVLFSVKFTDTEMLVGTEQGVIV